MIRATELGGRAVVDVDAAEKLGKVDRVVLDPDARHVAGFVVSQGSSLFNQKEHLLLAASAVHAIGPDAITVHRGDGAVITDGGLDHLPRVSDMVGRKVVSEQGRLLGTVDDVLIDESDGRIVGYTLAGGDLDDKIKQMMSKEHTGPRKGAYLRADANLRAGKDLMVAPEDAVAYDWDTLDQPTAASANAVGTRPWSSRGPGTGRSPWIRNEDGSRTLAPQGEER